ncbi:heme-binding protein 2-like [Phalaenopsis equestris]|uniref:heme-binding protein 2-like n=1 Tax=Phalaenopsis equestris TaxID=78828 RepID=UPI0009E4906D|nr:heme-binding protein 2-like [Phalaenopsis equestris]
MAMSPHSILPYLFPFTLLLIFSTPGLSSPSSSIGVFPPTCKRIECPGFDVIDEGDGYEIRRYNSTPWISTSQINEISFVEATRIGFLQLFSYIQGNNEYNVKIDMTAPVITQIVPSDGPFCTSSFVVSFYVPKENQADPPPANGLHLQKWGVKYAAVRQFAGFVLDSEVGVEAAALYSSLAGSNWASAIDKSRKDYSTSLYTVAQYNSPFEYTGRVNEIWILFDEEDISSG